MKTGNFRRRHLKWIGNAIVVYDNVNLVEIVPDPQWPKMWRIKFPDGRLSDMVNLTRAKDAAMDAALSFLNLKQAGRAADGPPSGFSEG